jgi:hypothetical protein
MPQLIALAVAGAGLYAGYRWVSRQIGRVREEAHRAEEELRRRAAAARGPVDLGALEFDEVNGVYRPRT